MSGQVWVSTGRAVEQVLSHHGHHGEHRAQHHVLTPLALALQLGCIRAQLWCLAQTESH